MTKWRITEITHYPGTKKESKEYLVEKRFLGRCSLQNAKRIGSTPLRAQPVGAPWTAYRHRAAGQGKIPTNLEGHYPPQTGPGRSPGALFPLFSGEKGAPPEAHTHAEGIRSVSSGTGMPVPYMEQTSFP